MNQNSSMDELERRATEALRALLGQVSVIKVKEIRRTAKGPLLAQLEVLGHTHTLACDIQSNARPESVRQALDSLHQGGQRETTATPVVIAPYLSPEAQALCKERAASYLDLEGNARLAVGEVFIGKRSQPPRVSRRRSEPSAAAPVLHPFPPVPVAPHSRSRSLMA